VHEAMGLGADTFDIQNLRIGLSRLGFLTHRENNTLETITPEMTPCLFVPDRHKNDIWIIFGHDDNGRLNVFKSLTNVTAAVPPDYYAGRVYSVQKIAAATEMEQQSRKSWFSTLIAGEAATIRTLVWLTFAINLVVLAVPVYMIAVFDKAVATKSSNTLGYLFAGILIVLAIEFLLREVRAANLAYLGARMEGLIMPAAFGRLLLLPIQMTETASIGSQITRLKLFEAVRDIFSGPLAAALLDLPFIFLFVSMVFVVGGNLGWIVLAFVLALALLVAASTPAAREKAALAGHSRSETRKFLMEFTNTLGTIRSCGAERTWLRRYGELTSANLKHTMAAHSAGMNEQLMSQILVVLTGTAIIGVGSLEVIAGDMTAGTLIAVMAIVWRLLAPIQTAFLNLSRLSQGANMVRQLNMLMRMAPEYDPAKLPSFDRQFKGHVAVRGVSFRYTPYADPSLKGVSLTLEPGSFVALTGKSGCGKSTLLKLFARLYLPQAGVILFDGLDYRQFNPKILRHAMSIVPEAHTLFHGTIAENIRIAHPIATDAEIERVLEELGAAQIVLEADGGIYAMLDGRDPTLSTEAFAQTISLARAFIKSSPIYLLDEPSAHLKEAGDRALQSKLETLKGKATIILATSRASYMYLAGRTIVMETGQIVADGLSVKIVPEILQRQSRGWLNAPAPAQPLSNVSVKTAQPKKA